jgi:hypothetical protein
MTCGHCERAVTQAVQQLDAQAKVAIDRAQGKVVVESSLPLSGPSPGRCPSARQPSWRVFLRAWRATTSR